jgi:hypothetical protein
MERGEEEKMSLATAVYRVESNPTERGFLK